MAIACEDAQRNAEQNAIKNAEFLAWNLTTKSVVKVEVEVFDINSISTGSVVGIMISSLNPKTGKLSMSMISCTLKSWMSEAGKAEDLIPRILGDLDPAKEVVAVVDPSRAG